MRYCKKNVSEEVHCQLYFLFTFRSSRSQMFLKVGVLKNFANFTETSLFSFNFSKVFYKCFWRILPIFQWLLLKSNHLQMLCKISVLKNFEKLTGKHLCLSHFFNEVARLRLFLPNTSGGCFWLSHLETDNRPWKV